MPEKPRDKSVVTNIEGEVFLYKELWRVVGRQLDYAIENETGAFYDRLVAMVFSFMVFEAYLNFAGERLDPEIWKDERVFFQKEPYRGFMGKLKFVLERCGGDEPD